MEKNADIAPGRTPDVEDALKPRPGEKKASTAEKRDRLDDDLTHKLQTKVTDSPPR